MDKRLILAVAGSGKTSHIISNLNLEERSLIITYTIANTRNLKNRIQAEFGFYPENIEIYSYYEFLYKFCVRPFLGYKFRFRGIFWQDIPESAKRFKKVDNEYYITDNGLLYHNRMALLVVEKGVDVDIRDRLLKYYDRIYVDEVQDFGGHDFNLLMNIAKMNLSILLVGDYYQHTFDTSRDGNVNKNLHKEIERYKTRFQKIGINLDEITLSNSYRCTDTVCQFIRDNLAIEIYSHKIHGSPVFIVDNPEMANELICDDGIVKLVYWQHHLYKCYTNNWGNSKGVDDYQDVCVVLSDNIFKLLNEGRLGELAPMTRNKLYVACTRTHNNLFIIPHKYLKYYKN